MHGCFFSLSVRLKVLSIDVSTGDVITPDAVKYEIIGIFDENIRIRIWGYNIEMVIAEKAEEYRNVYI